MMRVVAYIVLAVSLIAGFIGAITAYIPKLEQVADAGETLHTNAPAGARKSDEGDLEPIIEPRSELTSEAIAQLESAGVQRLRVREFSFGRWTGWWLYMLGAAGLLGAGFFLRKQGKVVVPASALADVPSDPRSILEEMRRRVEELLRALPAEPVEVYGAAGYAPPGVPTPAQARPPFATTVIEQVGQIQKTLMPAFIDARPSLVAAFGMAGYAHLMDSYAAAERSMNRAWSAAADNDEIEAIASLERALALLDEAAARLPGRAG